MSIELDLRCVELNKWVELDLKCVELNKWVGHRSKIINHAINLTDEFH